MFSLEQLLFALGYDQRVPPEIIQQMLPMLQEVNEKETAAREQLKVSLFTIKNKLLKKSEAYIFHNRLQVLLLPRKL